jgi:hypothetical protein
MAGMTMTEAVDSDPFLSVVLKISTDLNDTLDVIEDAITTGTSIPDAFDYFSAATSASISAASGDLVEFEVRKFIRETSYYTAVDEFV